MSAEPLSAVRLSGESPCSFASGDDGWMVCAVHGWSGPREQRSRVLICPEASIEPRMAQAYRETIAHLIADRANLRDRLRRLHYPPQIGTHYEQGFADCLRAVLAEFERP